MAFVTQVTCEKCFKTWQGVKSKYGKQLCHECTEKEKDRKHREHFHGLDGLTLQERVRKIEEWIYNYEPEKGLSDIRFT